MKNNTNTRPLSPADRRDAGTATLTDLTIHWAVSAPTARAIIRASGLPDVSAGCYPRYRWTDIWRFERAGFVHPVDWAEFRCPLLRPADLSDVDPRGRSARTWRRLLNSKKLDSIRLSPAIRRVRPAVFEALVDYI